MRTAIYLDVRSMHETLKMVIDITAVMLVKKRRKMWLKNLDVLVCLELIQSRKTSLLRERDTVLVMVKRLKLFSANDFV